MMKQGWIISSLCYLPSLLSSPVTMIKIIFLFTLSLFGKVANGQSFDRQKEFSSITYQQTKSQALEKLKNNKPGKFGEFIPGVMETVATDEKNLALTFDACGGLHGNGFDRDLIDFLKQENLPATLFITGGWIEKNLVSFQQLCSEPLFEIENHGLTHHPCTLGNESKYGIKGTGSASEGFDEIELNALQIEFYTHRKPEFYRPATAATDEGCVAMAKALNETIVSYSVLSGDAVAGLAAETIKENIIKRAKPGGIIIMHMNHPEWNSFEALRAAIPILRQRGYRFVKLNEAGLQPMK